MTPYLDNNRRAISNEAIVVKNDFFSDSMLGMKCITFAINLPIKKL